MRILTSRQRALSIMSMVCALLLAPAVSADTIRYDFAAQVTYTQVLPIFGISPVAGDAVTGYFTYDTDAVDLNPGDPSAGRYASGTISITIGGLTLSSAAAATQFKYDTGTNDLWSIISGVTAGEAGILVDGVPTLGGDLLLHFKQSGNLLPGDGQPDLADFGLLTVSQFAIRRDVPGTAVDSLVLFDTVTSSSVSTVPVPLPGTLPLLLTGMGLLALRLHAGRSS